jgi:hypothetical protein
MSKYSDCCVTDMSPEDVLNEVCPDCGEGCVVMDDEDLDDDYWEDEWIEEDY